MPLFTADINERPVFVFFVEDPALATAKLRFDTQSLGKANC